MSAEPRSRELRSVYEAGGAAAHYAGERWRGSRHGRRTARRERRLVAELLAAAGPLRSALDVPCGAGRFADLLRARAGRVLGADIARAMLDRARGAAAGWNGLAQASVAALPFAAGAVDLVLCFRLLHHFRDSAQRRALLAELARVSRRWALVSYFDAASFQAWRHRVRRRPTARFAQPGRLFAAEAAAAGFRVHRRAWVARGLSEQVVVLLEKEA